MDLPSNRSILQDKTNLISEATHIKQSGKGSRNPVDKASEVHTYPTSKNLEKSVSKQTVSSDSCSFNSALQSSDTDATATADYDSAGESEYVLAPDSSEQNLNLTSLANSLDGLHIATPHSKSHSPHDCSLFAVKFTKSEFSLQDREEFSSEANSSIVDSDQENEGSLSGILNLSNVSVEEITVARTTPLEFIASVENFENRRLSAARHLAASRSADRGEPNENNTTGEDAFGLLESLHLENHFNDTTLPENSRPFSGIPNLSNVSYEEISLTGITPFGFIASAENFESSQVSATIATATVEEQDLIENKSQLEESSIAPRPLGSTDENTVNNQFDEKDLIGNKSLVEEVSSKEFHSPLENSVLNDNTSASPAPLELQHPVNSECSKSQLISNIPTSSLLSDDKGESSDSIVGNIEESPKHKGVSSDSVVGNIEESPKQLLLSTKEEFDINIGTNSPLGNINNSVAAVCESSTPQETDSCNITSSIPEEITINSSVIVDKPAASECSNLDLVETIKESSETETKLTVESSDISKPDSHIDTFDPEISINSKNALEEQSKNLLESITEIGEKDTVDGNSDLLQTSSSLERSQDLVENSVCTVGTQDSSFETSNQKKGSIPDFENIADDLNNDCPANVSISKELSVAITDDLTETVISDLLAKAENCSSSQSQDLLNGSGEENNVSVNVNIEAECNEVADTKLECPEAISPVNRECDQVLATESNLSANEEVQNFDKVKTAKETDEKVPTNIDTELNANIVDSPSLDTELNAKVVAPPSLVTELNANIVASPSLVTELNANIVDSPTLVTVFNANIVDSQSLDTELNAKIVAPPTLVTELIANILDSPSLVTELNAKVVASPTLVTELNANIVDSPSLVNELNAKVVASPSLATELNAKILESKSYLPSPVNEATRQESSSVAKEDAVNERSELNASSTSLDESLPLLDAIDESFQARTEDKFENFNSGLKSSEKERCPEQEKKSVSSKFTIANLNKTDSDEPIKESAILDNISADEPKTGVVEPFENCVNQAALNGPNYTPIEDLKNNNCPVAITEGTAPKLIETTSSNSTNTTQEEEVTSHGINAITENFNKSFSRQLDYVSVPQAIEVPAVDEFKNEHPGELEKEILEEAFNKLSIEIRDDLLKGNSFKEASKSPKKTFPVSNTGLNDNSTLNPVISSIATENKQSFEENNVLEVESKSECLSEDSKIVPVELLEPNFENSEKIENIEELNFDDSLTEQALNLSREILLNSEEQMSDNFTVEMDNRMSSPAKSGDPNRVESNGLGNHGGEVDLDKTFEKKSESPTFDSTVNSSEAGPITAEEFSIPASAFQFDFDSLPCGVRNPILAGASLTRNSLYVKFDPIVGKILANSENSPVHFLSPKASERLEESSLDRTPMKNPTLDEKLISITPCSTVNSGDANSSVTEQLDSSIDSISNKTIVTVFSENLNKTDPDITQCVSNLTIEAESKQSSSSLTPQTNKLQTSKTTQRGTVVSQEYYLKELEKLQDLMSKQEQGYQEELEKLKFELSSLKKEMHSKAKALSQSDVVLGEYERTISQLVAQNEADKKQFELLKEKLIQERDTVTIHLNNTEIAFNDVHQKYERSKTVIEEMKNIQDTLKASNQEYEKSLKAQEDKYNKLRSHVAGQLEKANHEMEAMTRSHQAENERLRARLKQAEIAMKSLENSNEHKSKEIKELTQILDELIGKVGTDGV